MRPLVTAATVTATSMLGLAQTAGADTTEAHLEVRRASTQAAITYDYCIHYIVGGVDRGIGCWKAYGDHMLARDVHADGYWIKVDWHTDYGRDGKLADGNSNGDGNQQNYDMDEDGSIRFQVELWDEDHQVLASGWGPYAPIGQ